MIPPHHIYQIYHSLSVRDDCTPPKYGELSEYTDSAHTEEDRSDNPSHHEWTLLPGHIQMHFITTSPLTYVTFKCCKHVINFVILATRYGVPDEDCHMQLEESETCYYFCYFSNTVWNTWWRLPHAPRRKWNMLLFLLF